MPRFKITIAYDGTDFVGWQRQAAGASVQGLLEDAAGALDEPTVTVIGAGRTDAGVHAIGQVAAMTLARPIGAEALIRALNARLPDAIRVVHAVEVGATFHPQFDACAKTYRYRIWNAGTMSPFERRYAWHVPAALDLDAMCVAARTIEGEHDFAAFQAAGSDVATTVRRIAASTFTAVDAGGAPGRGGRGDIYLGFPIPPVERDRPAAHGRPTLLCYEITGTGFLRHMVRTIVGSLVEVGRRRRSADWIGSVMASRDRGAAGQTAPPQGLFLVRVDYPGALASDT